MVYVVFTIINSVAFGYATRAVIRNKGYDDDWFWWGFLFGVFALIVACTKPRIVDYSSYSSQSSQPTYINNHNSYGSTLSIASDATHNEKLLADGGWKCSCGQVHASYVSSCSCGKSKREVQGAAYEKGREEARKQCAIMTENDKVSAIKEYKELLDAGVISQEEFETKKKQLIGL